MITEIDEEKKKVLLVGPYYVSISRCTVHRTSNFVIHINYLMFAYVKTGLWVIILLVSVQLLNKGTDFHKSWFQQYAFRTCCSLPSNLLLLHFRTWTPRINTSGPCGQLLRSHLSSLSLFCLSPEVGLFHPFCPWGFQIKARFLMTEELSPTLCPTYFHFCCFIWAATGFCVAPSPQFLFADSQAERY